METLKISCLIVDDEPMALNLIEGYVHKTPFLELKGRCSSAFEAMEYLAAGPVTWFFSTSRCLV
jgi:response regulator of citrate/malate metabolism